MTGYTACIVKGATKIRLNASDFKGASGVMLSQAWYPVMNMLYNQKSGPKQSEHLTPITSTHWLACSHEHCSNRYIHDLDWTSNHSSALRTRTEMVLKTSDFSPFNHLTRLVT
ncbi:hypothetical protein L798_09239 [Zootermopsis nevadensis]|uniref:Uncharacterized protein n=1 Tax=Zootermopsis nevadensis TaxID=136037 RepID=A0A067RB82_ZOONE|nr:hypothetical protein L798_09239 [Zootermopsis nevadensis]